MTFQAKEIDFSISNNGESNQQKTVTFSGSNITANAAWVCIQSINVSYDGGSSNHDRGISKFVPRIQQVSGTNVSVTLDFLYANNNPSEDSMLGTVSVLVLADVA